MNFLYTQRNFMSDFFLEPHIQQKPIAFLAPLRYKAQELACPFCSSKNVQENGSCTTLVGFSGGINPNHVHVSCQCNDCQEKFCFEYKGYWDNKYYGWYTKQSNKKTHCLKGINACHETYSY